METTIERHFAAAEVMEAAAVNGLQAFGLKRTGQSSLSYLTLDEALEKDLIAVTEVSESGTVPALTVSNKADQMLFLMSGEHLKGAKQDRVLNVSIMVPANSQVHIPVSCVESGRWHYRSKQFGSSGTAVHALLRAKMSKDVLGSYRTTGMPSSNQRAVWDEVSRKLGKMGSRSPTSALGQVFEDYDSRLKTIADQIQVPEGCSGVVVAFGGRIAGLDCFDKPDTLHKLWPKLVRSYAIDAMEETDGAKPLTCDAISEWLKGVFASKLEKFPSPGLGDDFRFENKGLVGASLFVDEELVHTEVFNDVCAG
jgi:hypothetical protein